MSETTTIHITRSGNTVTYEPAECTLSQLVFWKNDDPQSPHWVYFPGQAGVGPRFATGPGDTSDPVQPATSIPKGQTNVVVTYACKEAGHENERGQVTVWPDFLVVQPITNGVYNQLANGTVGVDYPSTLLTTGGKPNYSHTLTDASMPPGMAVTNTPAGVAIGGTPTAAGQDYAFTVHCVDALGNRVDQTFTIVVA